MLTILIVTMCLFLNGVFSSFEMAYITITPDRLYDLISKHKRMQILNEWKRNPERILSTIQIGITFVGGLAAVIGGAQLADTLRHVLINNYAFQPMLANLTSIFLIILPLTYLNVVFGELLPKAIALRSPEKVLMRVLFFIVLMDKIFSPIISFLESSTQFLVNLLHLDRRNLYGDNSQKIDIKSLDNLHRRYVLDLVKLKEKLNRDILVPWQEVVTLDFSNSKDEVMAKIIDYRHTRLPVMKEGEVIGLLNTKEYTALPKDKNLFWQSIVRPVLKFSAKKSALSSFKEMQRTQNQMAWISDEKDHPLGMITMENIIEEFLGDIYDEDDDDRLRRLIERKRGMS